jgi:predicted RNA-binding Zn-ribbon protein involved in translation (DUF1610 family)
MVELACPHCGNVMRRGLGSGQPDSLKAMVGARCDACGQPITLAHVAGWMKERALDQARTSLAERRRASERKPGLLD